MSHHSRSGSNVTPWEASEVEAAAREAAAIGGRAGDEDLDPAERPVIEAGEGVAEGFELAEQDLIEAATQGDGRGLPLWNRPPPEDAEAHHAVYGEGDEEHSSESAAGDR
jgi:hypothetical protein